jgi:hypothetical protein
MTSTPRAVFITQPTYLPWIGIFKAVDLADEYVFYDDVQYERKSWQNRNRIRNVNGGELILTVPVKHQHQDTLICDIELSKPDFWQLHLKQIQLNYASEPYTKEVVDLLEYVYRRTPPMLSLLNQALIVSISSHLGLKTNWSQSSNYAIDGDRDTRPAKFARYLEATDYWTQIGTKPYFNEPAFEGINVHWLDVTPPNQLSIVDYLCRLGPTATKDLIQHL